MSEAFSGHLRVEIFDWRDHALDTGGNQRVSAWWCAAVMSVRFEGDVCSAATGCLACEIERDRFGVPDCFEEIVTFPDDLARRADDHAADEWSRADLPHAFL